MTIDWSDIEMELDSHGREDLAIWVHDEVSKMKRWVLQIYQPDTGWYDDQTLPDGMSRTPGGPTNLDVLLDLAKDFNKSPTSKRRGWRARVFDSKENKTIPMSRCGLPFYGAPNAKHEGRPHDD